MPPLAMPAPTPAAVAGCQAREINPAPKAPETLPNAAVLPGRFFLGTTKVLVTAYFKRGQVPCK